MWIRELTCMSHFEPGACLGLLPNEECQWSTWDVWQSADVVERAIYVSLTLMLAYTFFVLIRFLRRYISVRRNGQRESVPNFQPERIRLISDLIGSMGMLRGIAIAAPFLGLAGTSYGILAALSYGGSWSRYSFLYRISWELGLKLTSAMLGILVAIAATVFHNGLRRWLENYGRIAPRGKPFSGSLRRARTLSLKKRFSGPPQFALLSAPILACALMFFVGVNPNPPATGLAVALPNAYCQHDAVDRVVVLSITNEGKLLINTESLDWTDLRNRLDAIYATRAEKALYLRAEDGVSLQRVADAIDIARNSPASDSVHITVALLTPGVRGCVPLPVRNIRTK